MKVILLDNIKKIGKKHEIKDLSEGYIRNFLIPRGLAKIATPEAIKEIEKIKFADINNLEDKKTSLNELRNKLQKNPLKIYIKTGEKHEIFSGIHKEDIIKALIKEKLISEKDEIEIDMDKPIKKLGEAQFEANLGRGVKGMLKLEVVPQQP
ncbi:MAG TPA: 50S ribosomal protein L9 [Candidatus Paceibacterota bacterium]